MSDITVHDLQQRIKDLRANLARVIQGKSESIEMLTIAMAAGGSVLMEDVPGVGKTTLAKALATSIQAAFSRIQFTPDLLPADILGSSIYDPSNGQFHFREGPIFCNVLLADEINRASPRTQSALLEAMSEMQATIEGERHVLPEPFFVLATQNPIEFHGTYPLPEAQLDRFLALVRLGYPDSVTEVDILYAQAEHHPLEDLRPVLSREEVVALQQAVRRVRVERSVTQYMVDLVRRTREDPRVRLG
ncbi:MAG: AAA family ATPase, partial [Candidatus Hydrogenedentes bacterium]|nr:AAA family ATPase [Candidatus Hydrogenedentota bacterium]